MYNSRRLLYSALLFCFTLTFFSFRPVGNENGKKKWVIVIDAGHGGKDPGCHGKRFQEKNVALAVALKFGHYIEQNNKDVTVIYTRKTDVFIPLNERAEIANRNHADLFVCIHCNASLQPDASGAATYVMGLKKSEGNLEVAKRENSSILFEKNYKQTYGGFDPNSDEAAVLFAMYQNLYLGQSLDLSSKIQHQYETLVKTTDNGVKQAGFLVLWKTAMPSLLTEIGFLTNVDEEKVLGSQKGQDEIAKSIFLAFEQYKAEKDGTTYTASSYDLKPLVLKDMADTISTDSTMNEATMDTTISAANKVATTDSAPKNPPVPKEIKKAVAKTDTASKKYTHVAAQKPSDKPIAKVDSNALRIKRMQEAINIKPADTTSKKSSIEYPMVALQYTATKHVDSIAKMVTKETKHTDSLKSVTAKSFASTKPINDDTLRIIYKVQFLVSAHPLNINDSKYTGIKDMSMYTDNSICKYTAGHFDNVKDAIDLQMKMRNDGYKDAFVVTFRGNKRVILPKVSAK